MLFSRSIFVVALASVSLVSATASQVLSDLKIVDALAKDAATQCNNFQGTSAQFINFQNSLNKYDGQNNVTTKDVKASAAFTATESQTIYNYVKDPVLASEFTITRCIRIKPWPPWVPTLCSILRRIKASKDAFFDSLIAQFPIGSIYRNQLIQAKADYDSNMNDVLAALKC